MSTPIKSEPVRSQRLSGFKLPRDLSLGGAAPKVPKEPRGGSAAAAAANKKVFTPNLNVTRNKATVSTDSGTTANGRTRGGRIDRGRGGRGGQGATRGRGKAVAIQSVGLFSEGIAAQPIRRSSQARASYGEGGSTRRSGTGKSLKSDTIDHENLSEFMNDDDEDCHLEAMSTEDDFAIPIVLKNDKGQTINDEHKRYPQSLHDFFQRTTPQIFLIQLPDTLPGQGNSVVEVKKTSVPSSEDNPEQTETDQNDFCLMKGLPEGLIGKFIRHKSGKTKLVLGNTRFDVSLGLEPGFLQEVVSVRANTTERSGDMINLGKISAKVNVSPDWEDMFQSMNTT